MEGGAEVSATNWRNSLGVVFSSPTNPTGIGTHTYLNTTIASPAIGYGLLLNYHPRFGRHSARAGLYAGGGQLGYEFAITQRIAAGLECTPRYAHFTVNYPAPPGFNAQKVDYSLWYFPTLLNVGLKL